MDVNELALFSGAGGGILGGKLLGWRTVCAVEWEPYPASVLMQRQNDGILAPFPIWDDVRTFDGHPWRGRVDVVSGGFPCQAFSSAARGRNVAQNLWPEMRRIVADVAPRYVFAENVSKRAIDYACDELEEMGYSTTACCLSAKDLGGDHVRKRFWLRAHSDRNGELHGTSDAKMAELPELFSSIWASEPGESRMADGVACALDRLKATGNGQIPGVAALAWETLKP